jgi:hypothetical protein
VHDLVTGLCWQRVADPGPGEGGGFVAADTQAHCDALRLEGHSDFRLPTRIELVSLVDFSTQSPALDAPAFPGERSEAFWTASAMPGDAEQRFHVNFFFGYTTSNLVAYAQWVRCVRTERRPADGALAPATITAETATDAATGLAWQRAIDPAPISFAEAEERCASLVLGRADDFRVPSMKELQTLVHERSSGPLLLDDPLFPNAPEELVWSSSLLASDPARGWLVRFSDGYSLDATLETPGVVRCVR